ncbi:MAG: hypothetical protein ABR953_02605 [Candidatus Acidiferrales bacterium]|jgi:hypothetical protein
MAGQVHIAQQYKVENNRPVLIWSELQDWDGTKNQFHRLVQQRRKGKMVTVFDKWVENPPCDPARLFE